jgi:hypothetical protein
MGVPGADVQDKLDEIVAIVEGGKSVALSSSTVKLDRQHLLTVLDDLRELLPAEIARARGLLRDKDAILAEGREEAHRLQAAGEAERARLVSEAEIVKAAHDYARDVMTAAREQAAGMRAEVDEYADGRLAAFEEALARTLDQVVRGREKLHAPLPADATQIALPEPEDLLEYRDSDERDAVAAGSTT